MRDEAPGGKLEKRGPGTSLPLIRPMHTPKTYYDLRNSQVSTPVRIVSFFWDVVHRHRAKLGRVLDMGAGDARFATGGLFSEYVGIEIDPEAANACRVPANARIEIGCAFSSNETGFEACIGNPPYVRHHDLEKPWKSQTVRWLSKELGIQVRERANLFLHFLGLALLKTRSDGLVALVIPFEWVSKPSARPVREHLLAKKWAVSVYRFQEEIFDGVITSACITVIDKARVSGQWQYFDVDQDLRITDRRGPAGAGQPLLEYRARQGSVFARRGMSPGSQRVFTLTEGERIHHGLERRDVLPCVTSLRWIPGSQRRLTAASFEKYFVRAGHRCWLIKSRGPRLGRRVRGYLQSIPSVARSTSTCLNREHWYRYERVPVPDLLFHSGFTVFGPKVVVNSVGAVSVGAVFGIYVPTSMPTAGLQRHLAGVNFERRLVAHARKLKKIEVGQVNTVLCEWMAAS